MRFIDVPEELEDQFSPAAYLVPPIDDASENTIIINVKTMEGDSRLLDTIAHEGYPGHMYHYIYLRGLLEETGWYRQNMSLTGYYESWSQYAENFFDAYNTTFSNNYLETALDDPFYYLEYALGYSLLQKELRDAQEELGAAFDLRAFNEAFLSIGPTYFNLISPKLDAWVAARR